MISILETVTVVLCKNHFSTLTCLQGYTLVMCQLLYKSFSLVNIDYSLTETINNTSCINRTSLSMIS